MKGTSIPYRRAETHPALARHAHHSQARSMNPSLARRPFGRPLYLRVRLFLLGRPLRSSSSIRLSRIRCPWWNIPPHPPVQQAGPTLGRQARRVTVMNYSLGAMLRVGPVRTTAVGHEQPRVTGGLLNSGSIVVVIHQCSYHILSWLFPRLSIVSFRLAIRASSKALSCVTLSLHCFHISLM